MNKVLNILSILLLAMSIVFIGKALNLGPKPKMIEKINQLPAFETKDALEDLDTEKAGPLVRLEQLDGEFFCSGSVISNKYVLTAAHCLLDSNGRLRTETLVIKSTPDDAGIKISTEAIAASRNTRADFALVTGDFSQFNKLKIETDPTVAVMAGGVIGPVVACGFPWGSRDVCYTVGSGYPYFEGIAAKGLLYPGMSGGPVIDMATRTQVGVNSAVGNGFIIIMPLIGLFETLGVEVKD